MRGGRGKVGGVENSAEEESGAGGDDASWMGERIEAVTEFSFHVTIVKVGACVATEDTAWLKLGRFCGWFCDSHAVEGVQDESGRGVGEFVIRCEGLIGVDGAIVDVDNVKEGVVPVVGWHSGFDVDGAKLIHGFTEEVFDM